MPNVLQFEYACTHADLQEAQELNTCQQLGRGSKWRTQLILWLTMAVMLGAFYLKVVRELPPAHRAYAFGGVFVIFILISWWQKRKKPPPRIPTRLEASEDKLTIREAEGKITMPWSAFIQCLESPNLFVLIDRAKLMLYVFPKRAFPDEESQRWFREQIARRRAPASPVAAPVAEAAACGHSITLQVRLGFRDYLDRTLASWRTKGVILLMAGVMVGATMFSVIHPPPGAIHTGTEVFFMFVLPFLPAVAALVILVTAFQHWRAHTHYLVPQETVLSDEAISWSSRNGSGTFPWAAFTCYKETPWSYILWSSQEASWLLLPKRQFASPDERRSCHALLARHLRQSRWFLG